MAKAVALPPVSRFLIRDIANKHKSKLFMHKTVAELTFKGYKEPLMEELSSLQGGEELLPNNTFGIYYGVCSTVKLFAELQYLKKLYYLFLPRYLWWSLGQMAFMLHVKPKSGIVTESKEKLLLIRIKNFYRKMERWVTSCESTRELKTTLYLERQSFGKEMTSLAFGTLTIAT